jgi:hypothetical protein
LVQDWHHCGGSRRYETHDGGLLTIGVLVFLVVAYI